MSIDVISGQVEPVERYNYTQMQDFAVSPYKGMLALNMSSNWFNLSTAEQDRLCSYWKNNPNQAWESLQSSEVGEYLSKSKFTEFFASHCY